MFKNKSLLITGGTGSFGVQICHYFLKSDISEIRIFSRDEKKQDDMRNKFNNEKLKFFLGDVRDKSSISRAMQGVDFIFHAAALKQVPSCEFHPMEAVKTNITGTENVLDAAINFSVERVICLSTDKAVYPVNAMGISKAMMEKVALSHARQSQKTKIMITRYGNVMASRGSVIPRFVDQLLKDQTLTITDPKMTRFMMDLNEAVDLVLFAFKTGKAGDIFVQKSPSASIGNLAKALTQLSGKSKHPTNIIGTRHGEKLYEVLLSREETSRAEDLGNFLRVVQDNRDLNYSKYFNLGDIGISEAAEYNSHTAMQYNVEELKSRLSNLDYIKTKFKI